MEEGRPDLISGLSAPEWNNRFATLHSYLVEAKGEFRCGRHQSTSSLATADR
jgi:hypothetical protein